MFGLDMRCLLFVRIWHDLHGGLFVVVVEMAEIEGVIGRGLMELDTFE